MSHQHHDPRLDPNYIATVQYRLSRPQMRAYIAYVGALQAMIEIIEHTLVFVQLIKQGFTNGGMSVSWSGEGVKVSLKEEYAIEVHPHAKEEYVKRNVLNRKGQRRLEEILAYHEYIIRTQPSRLLLDLTYEIDLAIIHDTYLICTTLLNYVENISYSERLEAHPEAQTVHRDQQATCNG